MSTTTLITETEQRERASAVEYALATNRLEGLEPSDGAKAIFQRYVNGELNLEQMRAAIDEHADREYGPVRLPRNDRP